jgi:hypothetical protein
VDGTGKNKKKFCVNFPVKMVYPMLTALQAIYVSMRGTSAVAPLVADPDHVEMVSPLRRG